MTLEFHRECIIINGLPIIGTVTIEVEGERDRSHGLYHGFWLLDLTCTGFEPETPLKGLLWSGAEAPCETWLAANKARVEKRALEHARDFHA